MSDIDIEAMAQTVADHPDYEVLRRLVPKDVFHLPPDGAPTRYGLILDTETTGLDHGADRIVEIALLLFEFCPESGRVYGVSECHNGLEDPGMPIPPDSTAIHGITDDMVAGKQFDDSVIERLASSAALVVAHNASFDRPFAEQRFPVFAGIPWACSLKDINWSACGYGSGALEFLAYRCGFFSDKHRADADCRALLEVLQRPDEKGLSFIKSLDNRSRSDDFRIWASNSHFDYKDALKARRYKFDAPSKTWHISLPKEACRAECEWLRDNVYGGRNAEIRLDTISSMERFTERVSTTRQYRLPAA